MCLTPGGNVYFDLIVGGLRGGDTDLGVRELPAYMAADEEIDCRVALPIDPQLWERASAVTGPDNTLEVALREVKHQHDLAKAVKADDTTVPVHWWHDQVLGHTATAANTCVLMAIQGFVLWCYRQRLQQECISFLV